MQKSIKLLLTISLFIAHSLLGFDWKSSRLAGIIKSWLSKETTPITQEKIPLLSDDWTSTVRANPNKIVILAAPGDDWQTARLLILGEGENGQYAFENSKQYDIAKLYLKLREKTTTKKTFVCLENNDTFNKVLERINTIKETSTPQKISDLKIQLNVINAKDGSSIAWRNYKKNLDLPEAEVFAALLNYEIQKDPRLKNNLIITTSETTSLPKYQSINEAEKLISNERLSAFKAQIDSAIKDIKKEYTGKIALNIVKGQSNNSSLSIDTKKIHLKKDLNEEQAEAFAIILKYEIQQNQALKNNITITNGLKAPDKFDASRLNEAIVNRNKKIELYFYKNNIYPKIKIFEHNKLILEQDLNSIDAKTIEDTLKKALKRNPALKSKIIINDQRFRRDNK